MGEPIENVYKLVGARINELRQARRLTLEQLGARIGHHKSSVSNMERATQRIPLHVLQQISSVLGVTLRDLLPP